MIETDLYDNLPDDPEHAFLLLERAFREECELNLRRAQGEDDANTIYVDYMAAVLATIEALGLEEEFERELPEIQDVNYSTYINFGKDVKHYCTKLQILHSRRLQGFTVKFDFVAKQKIAHFIQQLREIVGRLEIDESKRDALNKRILALEDEVARDRTRLESYGELVISTAGILGEAANELEPLRKLLDAIGRIIWGARKDQQQESLPSSDERKRIEASVTDAGEGQDDGSGV